MNILMTSNKFFPSIGGIETVTCTLASYFVAAGHSVFLVTQSLGNSEEDKLDYPFTILRKPSVKALLACYLWSDIVFQNNPEYRQLWPTFFIKRPLVVTLQTWLLSVTGKRDFVNIIKSNFLSIFERVIYVSHSLASVEVTPGIVIGNPFRSNVFRILDHEAREQSIVFVGRLVPDKGCDLLLRSYAEMGHSEWPLTIIGSGPELPYLKILAKDLGISNSVNFLGFLQGEELVSALNRHELMVVPSLWCEPFGIVALEGLACGCTVLAADRSGLSDAVGSAGLLFKRGDQADLTVKLRAFINDTALRAKLRREAPSQLAKFRVDVVGNQYLNIFNIVAEEYYS